MSKKYDCDVCHTEDLTKYAITRPKLCKICYKLSKSNSYLCKYCQDTNKDNFYEGRYKNCRKCLNTSKAHKNLIKEKEKIYDEMPYDKESTLKIEKYICTDYRVFEGLTTKQIINESKERIDKAEEKMERLEEEMEQNRSLFLHIEKQDFLLKSEIKEMLDNFKSDFDRVVRENEELRNIIKSSLYK